jgi:hypothetical protein
VIAGPMPRVMAALEPCDAPGDQGRAGAAQRVIDTLEPIGMRPRKPAREVGLVVSRAR